MILVKGVIYCTLEKKKKKPPPTAPRLEKKGFDKMRVV